MDFRRIVDSIALLAIHIKQKHGLFLIIILIGFAFRLVTFQQNYQVDNGDVVRDYLVGNHIVNYKELPLVGPANSIYVLLPNSPLYYYTLAIPLLLHNSIFSNGYANIFLQLITVLSIYGLAWTLFNSRTALLVGILTVFSQHYIDQTYLVWQPGIEQTFFTLSYFFLAVAYVQKNYAAAMASGILFIVGLGMGFHGFPALPFFCVLLFLTVQSISVTRQKRLVIFAIMTGLLFIFYLPVILFLHTHGYLSFVRNEPAYIRSVFEYLNRLITNTGLLFQGSLHGSLLPSFLRTGIYIFLGLLIGHFFLIQPKRARPYVGAMVIFILQMLLVASFIRKEIQDYHFLAAFGPLLVLFSHVMLSILSKYRVGYFGTILFVSLLILLIVPTPRYLQEKLKGRDVQNVQTRAVRALSGTAKIMEAQYGPDWPKHINVEVFGNTIVGQYDPIDNIFWLLMEKSLFVQLTNITGDRRGFSPIATHPSHIFVICADYQNQTEALGKCVTAFQKLHSNFIIDQLLYDGGKDAKYIIYLAKLK